LAEAIVLAVVVVRTVFFVVLARMDMPCSGQARWRTAVIGEQKGCGKNHPQPSSGKGENSNVAEPTVSRDDGNRNNRHANDRSNLVKERTSHPFRELERRQECKQYRSRSAVNRTQGGCGDSHSILPLASAFLHNSARSRGERYLFQRLQVYRKESLLQYDCKNFFFAEIHLGVGVMSLTVSRIQVVDRYQQAISRVSNACQRAGRTVDAVTIVGVTKYVGSEEARWLAEAGCFDLGESRPQSLWEKGEALRELPIRWHLIGHLQRNKVSRTLSYTRCIHSVDSDRLLRQILHDSRELAKPLSFLIEINISNDASKTGLSFDDAKRLIQSWKEIQRGANTDEYSQTTPLQLDGLMGMGSLDGSELQTRKEFESLRLFRNACEAEFGLRLPQLSMGMSDDFEWAIEEGATMVRLGSTLFLA
jgi:pyridoxal phosphate enzyme (YggS family)